MCTHEKCLGGQTPIVKKLSGVKHCDKIVLLLEILAKTDKERSIVQNLK